MWILYIWPWWNEDWSKAWRANHVDIFETLYQLCKRTNNTKSLVLHLSQSLQMTRWLVMESGWFNFIVAQTKHQFHSFSLVWLIDQGCKWQWLFQIELILLILQCPSLGLQLAIETLQLDNHFWILFNGLSWSRCLWSSHLSLAHWPFDLLHRLSHQFGNVWKKAWHQMNDQSETIILQESCQISTVWLCSNNSVFSLGINLFMQNRFLFPNWISHCFGRSEYPFEQFHILDNTLPPP